MNQVIISLWQKERIKLLLIDGWDFSINTYPASHPLPSYNLIILSEFLFPTISHLPLTKKNFLALFFHEFVVQKIVLFLLVSCAPFFQVTLIADIIEAATFLPENFRDVLVQVLEIKFYFYQKGYAYKLYCLMWWQLSSFKTNKHTWFTMQFIGAKKWILLRISIDLE